MYIYIHYTCRLKPRLNGIQIIIFPEFLLKVLEFTYPPFLGQGLKIDENSGGTRKCQILGTSSDTKPEITSEIFRSWPFLLNRGIQTNVDIKLTARHLNFF